MTIFTIFMGSVNICSLRRLLDLNVYVIQIAVANGNEKDDSRDLAYHVVQHDVAQTFLIRLNSICTLAALHANIFADTAASSTTENYIRPTKSRPSSRVANDIFNKKKKKIFFFLFSSR